MNTTHPTPYPDVNSMIQTVLERVQMILSDRFIGMYLDGSLAAGDFDQASKNLVKAI
jgi:hypothetical protein